MPSPRLWVTPAVVVSTVLGLLAGVVGVLLATRSDDAAAADLARTVARVAPGVEPYAVRVLRRWDARRARAYARADERALLALYVAGSRTATADRAVLRGYRARGLTVVRMRTQLLGVQVVARAPRRLVLRVTDVLVDAVVGPRGEAGRWRLPRDGPSTRRVELRRDAGRWRVVEALAVGSGSGRDR